MATMVWRVTPTASAKSYWVRPKAARAAFIFKFFPMGSPLKNIVCFTNLKVKYILLFRDRKGRAAKARPSHSVCQDFFREVILVNR